MDIADLRAFLTVAERRNLTRAAELLNMTQPSLTRRLRRLEEELGVTLFRRTSRGMEPTEAGERLRERAIRLVEDVEDTMADVRALDAEPSGRLVLGLPASMLAPVGLPLVERVLRQLPRASLALREGISDDLELGLALGQIDLAILISPRTEARDLAVEPLAADPIHLVGPAGATIGRAGHASAEDLAELPLVLNRTSNWLRRRLEEIAGRRGFTLRTVLEVNSQSMMLALAERGLCYTVMPGCAIRPGLQAGRLAAAPLEDLKAVWTLARARRVSAPRVVAAVERMIQELFAERAAEGLWQRVDERAPGRIALPLLADSV